MFLDVSKGARGHSMDLRKPRLYKLGIRRNTLNPNVTNAWNSQPDDMVSQKNENHMQHLTALTVDFKQLNIRLTQDNVKL